MRQSSAIHFTKLVRECEQDLALFEQHETKWSWLRLLFALVGVEIPKINSPDFLLIST